MNWSIRILIFAVSAICISSCGTDPVPVVSNDNLQTAHNDSVIGTASDELDDLVLVALNSFADSGSAYDGRTDALGDQRFACTGTIFDFSNVSTDHTSGQLTITFPEAGCVEGIKQNVRKGSLIITWSGGKWYQTGSTHVITFNNYSLNGLVYGGSRTSTCTKFTFASSKILNVTWNIKADQTLTWPDGTMATFKVNKTRVWAHSTSTDQFRHTTGPESDYIIWGTNRHGKEFTVTLSTTLIFQRGCLNISKNYVPINGIKFLKDITNNKLFTIDYGASDCDSSYTLNVDGVTTLLYAKNDSSDD